MLTRQEITEVVEEAIRQAAEVSGLTEWYIFHALEEQQKDEFREEQLFECIADPLEQAFEGIPDPDDKEFWNHWEKWQSDEKAKGRY